MLCCAVVTVVVAVTAAVDCGGVVMGALEVLGNGGLDGFAVVVVVVVVRSPITCIRVLTRSRGAQATDDAAPEPTPARREESVS